jgi:DNA-binding IclR family transcriptional regulator
MTSIAGIRAAKPARCTAPTRRFAVLNALREWPGMTLTEIAAAIGVSTATAWEHAVRLERDGKVRKVGKCRTTLRYEVVR